MLSIDRFEDNFAVCIDDNEKVINVSMNLIDGNAKEGDILKFIDGRYKIDADKTKSQKAEIEALQDELFE